MQKETAQGIANFLGWLLVSAAILQIPLLLAGAMVAAHGSNLLFMLAWGLFAFTTAASLGLISRAPIGFYLLYAGTLVSCFGPRAVYIPFVNRLVPAGPQAEYYGFALNLLFVAVAAFCHWSIARASEPHERRVAKSVLIGFLVLMVPALAYWKSGIRVSRGEATSAGAVPFVGPFLASLESSQPLAYHAQELRHQQFGTVVFNGAASETNLIAFAEANDLKLMTNAAARVKFLPIVKTWKLDPEKFARFNLESDRCYIGRIPKGSKLIFQICHRPSTGRFTAMAMGAKPSEALSSPAGRPGN